MPIEDRTASRTAEFMALFRAIETGRWTKHRLFTDRFAFEFLSPLDRTAVRLSRVPLFGLMVPCYIDLRWPGARTSGIARTRLIDDTFIDVIKSDVFDQIVILGAGFDSRAY